MSHYKPTNREKKRQPRLGASYCVCDLNRVGDGERCVVCGKKNYARRAPRRDYR